MEILPSIHRIAVRGVNLLLIAEEQLTLADTGFRGSLPAVRRYIEKLGRSIDELGLIIVTHNHLDHSGAALELVQASGARVAAHEADLSELEAGLPYPDFALKALRLPLVSLLRPLSYPAPDQVAVKLKGGEVLPQLGGLQVIHTPGHTPGSISLYIPSRKLLVVGDLINHRLPRLRLPPRSVSCDIPQAVDSIKKLCQLDFEALCFGHGRPILKGAKEELLALLSRTQPG